MLALADGVIRFRHGRAGRANWLEGAILDQRVNLVGGGDTPADTARRDALLRAHAEDGLRPVTQWRQGEATDRVEPASSTLYPTLEPAYAGRAGATVRLARAAHGSMRNMREKMVPPG